jgi:hypothetical protein
MNILLNKFPFTPEIFRSSLSSELLFVHLCSFIFVYILSKFILTFLRVSDFLQILLSRGKYVFYFTLRYVFVTDIIDTLILSHCFSSSSSKMTSQDF